MLLKTNPEGMPERNGQRSLFTGNHENNDITLSVIWAVPMTTLSVCHLQYLFGHQRLLCPLPNSFDADVGLRLKRGGGENKQPGAGCLFFPSSWLIAARLRQTSARIGAGSLGRVVLLFRSPRRNWAVCFLIPTSGLPLVG